VSAKITDATRATVRLTGSRNQRGWEHVEPVAAALAATRHPVGLRVVPRFRRPNP
jgi:ABC-type enterobactin transport system permease subunit